MTIVLVLKCLYNSGTELAGAIKVWHWFGLIHVPEDLPLARARKAESYVAVHVRAGRSSVWEGLENDPQVQFLRFRPVFGDTVLSQT